MDDYTMKKLFGNRELILKNKESVRIAKLQEAGELVDYEVTIVYTVIETYSHTKSEVVHLKAASEDAAVEHAEESIYECLDDNEEIEEIDSKVTKVVVSSPKDDRTLNMFKSLYDQNKKT